MLHMHMDSNNTAPLQEVLASFSSAAKQQSTHGASSIVTRQLSKFSKTRRARDRCGGAAVSQCATAVLLYRRRDRRAPEVADINRSNTQQAASND